jgi:hypothetical protein
MPDGMTAAASHPAIHWPAGLAPGEAHLHAVNVLDTAATVEQIWPWLVRATRWHEHYGNCKRLTIDGGAAELSRGTRFRWWTSGVPVTTVVDDLVPNERLAWTGTGLGARGYHAWVLEPTKTGTRLVTEECQRGASVWVLRGFLRRALHVHHQRWLEGLARVALLGHPDAIPPSVARGDDQP